MQSIRILSRSAVKPLLVKSSLKPFVAVKFNRFYSSDAGLTKDLIQSRILEVLTSFEKVDPAKVSIPCI